MTAEAVSLDDITHWAPPGSCYRLQLLRLDRIHPVVSGNKWFKLRPNLAAAMAAGYTRVLSFGGGYSNHLVALACAAQQLGLRSLGLIRGRYEPLTPTLLACRDFGMELHFLSGPEYARLKSGDVPLPEDFDNAFVIPEGGASAAGIRGAAGIAAYIPPEATDVCVAVGTGTTLAGLDQGLPERVALHGYCAAKDCGGAEALLRKGRYPGRVHWQQVADPRFGRWTPELTRFMTDFQRHTGTQLDIVYTGKMMQAVYAQLAAGSFHGRGLVCIHTGGLQGNPPDLFQV